MGVAFSNPVPGPEVTGVGGLQEPIKGAGEELDPGLCGLHIKAVFSACL